MPLNMPNMGNISKSSESTSGEFFTHARRHLKHQAHKSQMSHEKNMRAQHKAAQDFAEHQHRTGKLQDAALNEDARRTRTKQNAERSMGRMHEAASREDQRRTDAQAKAQTAASAAHNARVRSGQAAPGPGAPPRVFAVPTPGHVKAAQKEQDVAAKQRDYAHGQAVAEDRKRTGVLTQQRNYAHTQAIGEQKLRDKGIIHPQQFSGSGFPQHQHPQGSSSVVLPGITGRQPRKNEFTTGSRHAQPGGLAAKGSQLAAWGDAKSAAVKARGVSRAAGGRDRGLSSAARDLENKANKPISEFE